MNQTGTNHRKWECAATAAPQRHPPAKRVPDPRRGPRLMTAARSRPGRYGHRDATLILIGYRHGLGSPSCACAGTSRFHSGTSCAAAEERHAQRQPLHGDELGALRQLQREQRPHSHFVFTTERGPRRTASPGSARTWPDRGGGDPVRGPPAHAAPCLWLRPRQRRARHPRDPGLAWPPQHPTHPATRS